MVLLIVIDHDDALFGKTYGLASLSGVMGGLNPGGVFKVWINQNCLMDRVCNQFIYYRILFVVSIYFISPIFFVLVGHSSCEHLLYGLFVRSFVRFHTYSFFPSHHAPMVRGKAYVPVLEMQTYQ